MVGHTIGVLASRRFDFKELARRPTQRSTYFAGPGVISVSNPRTQSSELLVVPFPEVLGYSQAAWPVEIEKELGFGGENVKTPAVPSC